MENTLSSHRGERDITISPDDTEMFYTIQGQQNLYSVIIYQRRSRGGIWSKPEVAPFSGQYSDLEATFSPDGKKIFFSSNRPIEGTAPKDYDIWYVEKTKAGWSQPKNVGKTVNTEKNEFYPSVTSNGNLYFTSEYDKGVGKEDIYVARFEKGLYMESTVLDTAVNSAAWEFNAYVSPDEQFILFTSYGRKDAGGGDLYISRKGANGKWMPAKNLAMINSSRLDYCPFVSFDKRILYFTSNRHNIATHFDKALTYEDVLKVSLQPLNGLDNIYWVDWQKVLESVK